MKFRFIANIVKAAWPASIVIFSGCGTLAIQHSEPAITCDASLCAEKWSAAQLWVLKHTSMKLQTVSDTIIDTYDPCVLMQVSSSAYGYRILREPIGDGRYQITMDQAYHCGLMRLHYDDPDKISEFNSFMRKGREAAPSVSKNTDEISLPGE